MNDRYPCTRFHEFFEVNGVYSMRNLTIFMTISTATIVVLYLTYKGLLTVELFTAYLLSGAGVYSYGKYRDSKETIATTESTTPPANIISDTTQVKTDNGDVNISTKTVNKKKGK